MNELQFHGLDIVTATSAGLIDAIKKVDGHGHQPDWRHMIDLAMNAINVLSGFVAYAEQQIDRQAPSEGVE